jgi:hypothetical protein
MRAVRPGSEPPLPSPGRHAPPSGSVNVIAAQLQSKAVPFSAAEYAHKQRLRWMIPMALVVFVFTVCAWVYLHDDALPYDGNLAMPAVDVSSAVPAAPGRLKLLLNSVRPPPSDARNLNTPWTWDTPTLSLVTNANGPCFDNMRDLNADSDWHPNQVTWFAEDMGSDPSWRQLGVIKGIACAYYQRLAQEPAALRAELELAEFSQRLLALTAYPTYYARSVELHQAACEGIAEQLRTTSLDARALTPWQEAWEHQTPQEHQLSEAFRGFYEFERKLIVGPRAGDPWDSLTVQMMPMQPGRLFFKPNRTLSLFAISFLELKEQALSPAYLRSTQISARIGPYERAPSNIYGPNHAGLAYAHERIWPYVNLMERHSLERARHQVVLTLFAVRRWGADHASAPAKLEDLVPHYFKRLPIDPFSGEPVCYDAKKGLIYSVGIDLKDDHGHATEVPLEDAREPTVSIR